MARVVVSTVAQADTAAILRDLATEWLVVDADLTALVVSDQARTYEGAAFGYAISRFLVMPGRFPHHRWDDRQ